MTTSYREPADYRGLMELERSLLEERLSAHKASTLKGHEGDRFLNAARDDVLYLPTAALVEEPSLLAELNGLLGEAGLRPFIEEESTREPTGAVTVLRRDDREAENAYETVRERSAARSPALARVVSHLTRDRLYDAGALVAEPVTLVAAGTRFGHGIASLEPVEVLAPGPPWRALPGRRPVIAVLDSGIDDSHSWLRPSGAAEPFCVDAAQLGWNPPRSVATNRLYAGHGTFIAGLVRQVAPDVAALSVRVMHDDGVVYACDFEQALDWLLQGLIMGTEDRRVDVLLIAFGYEEDPGDEPHTERLRSLLRGIARHDVQIVASAGNRGHSRKTYPAAFAGELGFPVTSIGATNPGETTQAYYSNHGDWVKRCEVGTGVVSTMPRGLDGPRERPDRPTGFLEGLTLDPDKFASGFGRWSGTSFAAAVHAARLAQGLVGAAWADRL